MDAVYAVRAAAGIGLGIIVCQCLYYRYWPWSIYQRVRDMRAKAQRDYFEFQQEQANRGAR